MTTPSPPSPIRLAFPACEPGIGKVISVPESGGLIAGVRIAPIRVWADDRGEFFEVARAGEGLIAGFDPADLQVSATSGYPGAIKAFHYHLRQADCWAPWTGMLQVALVDLREGSATQGERNTLYLGARRPWSLLIPAGVAHGYKVIGDTRASVIYLASRHYDRTDEGRLPYDDPRLNYDWSQQHH
jgi:dTDP-4-dehydrorhamnose 3,5-epimerase